MLIAALLAIGVLLLLVPAAVNWMNLFALGMAGFGGLIVYALGDLFSLRRMSEMNAAQMQANYEQQLEGSGIDQRLLDGSYEQDAIFAHTPAPLRWLLRGHPPGDKLAQLDRISANLSWYLGPPRRFVRATWLAALPIAFNALIFLPTAFIGGFNSSSFLAQLPFAGVFVLMAVLTGVSLGVSLSQMNTPFLARYLRRSWQAQLQDASGQAAGLDAASAGAGALGEAPVSRRLSVSLNLILNQLQQDLQLALAHRQVFVLMPLLLSTTLLLVPGGAGMQGPIDMLWRMLLIIVGVGAVAVMLPRYVARMKQELATGLKRRLEASELTASLLAGEAREDQLLDHTPWPFDQWLRLDRPPPAYAAGLRRTLWRVALNLDWFLNAPARYVPVALVCRLGYIVLGLGLLVTVGLWFASIFSGGIMVAGSPFTAVPIVVILLLGCLVSYFELQQLIRDWAGADALVDVLRQSLRD